MGETDIETMANVTIAKWDFDDEAFLEISDDAKDFISKLLVKDKEWVFGKDVAYVFSVVKCTGERETHGCQVARLTAWFYVYCNPSSFFFCFLYFLHFFFHQDFASIKTKRFKFFKKKSWQQN